MDPLSSHVISNAARRTMWRSSQMGTEIDRGPALAANTMRRNSLPPGTSDDTASPGQPKVLHRAVDVSLQAKNKIGPSTESLLKGKDQECLDKKRARFDRLHEETYHQKQYPELDFNVPLTVEKTAEIRDTFQFLRKTQPQPTAHDPQKRKEADDLLAEIQRLKTDAEKRADKGLAVPADEGVPMDIQESQKDKRKREQQEKIAIQGTPEGHKPGEVGEPGASSIGTKINPNSVAGTGGETPRVLSGRSQRHAVEESPSGVGEPLLYR
ncbi:hypothetical protein R1sor_005458 [Riccia sorocarpa]|uniref:Uncharacterized protein n=1 Tax=Riccia sorocarpa TaxID=122646 RepID=A0ABD3HML7_9MARC